MQRAFPAIKAFRKPSCFSTTHQTIQSRRRRRPLPDTHAGNQMFSMYVYGSRDLRNWYMIGASQYKGYTPLLQIGKTSSKFKAFIVTMGGNLTKGSEISPLQLTIGDFYTEKLR